MDIYCIINQVLKNIPEALQRVTNEALQAMASGKAHWTYPQRDEEPKTVLEGFRCLS